MKLGKQLSLMIATAMAMAASVPLHAATISLNPASISGNVGDAVSIDVILSGLPALMMDDEGNDVPLRVSQGSFSLTWDTAILSLTSGSVNTAVINSTNFQIRNLDSFGNDGSWQGLFLNQSGGYSFADPVALATFNFSLASATSTPSDVSLNVGNAGWGTGGIMMPISMNYAGATVNVSAPTAVPIPAAAWLLGSGVLALVGMRARTRRGHREAATAA